MSSEYKEQQKICDVIANKLTDFHHVVNIKHYIIL